MNNKKLYLVQFLIFVTLISLPLGLSKVIGSGFDQSVENRFINPKPDYSLSNINNLPSQFEAYFNDRFAFRDKLIGLNASVRFDLFKTSPSNTIVVGKNDFNFYTGWQNYDISRNLYDFPQETIDSVVAEQIAWQKELEQRGIEYFVAFTPSKVTVYPEYLPDGGREMNSSTPIDIIEQNLINNSTVNVINTKPSVIEYKSLGNVFHKTDTHWTGLGAYAGYKAIMEKMIEKNAIDKDYTKVDFVNTSYKGEFSAMMGSINLIDDEPTITTSIIDKKAVKIYDEPKVMEYDLIRESNDFTDAIYYFKNEAMADKPTILIFGDSYFGSWNVNELFAENFSETYFVWTSNKYIGTTGIDFEIIDAIQPDIVLFERTERFINVLGKAYRN